MATIEVLATYKNLLSLRYPLVRGSTVCMNTVFRTPQYPDIFWHTSFCKKLLELLSTPLCRLLFPQNGGGPQRLSRNVPCKWANVITGKQTGLVAILDCGKDTFHEGTVSRTWCRLLGWMERSTKWVKILHCTISWE